MASTSPSISPFGTRKYEGLRLRPSTLRRRMLVRAAAAAADDASSGEPPPPPLKGTPGVDTRIHWSDPDEGWIGGKTHPQGTQEKKKKKKDNLGERFADLISTSTSTHYQFLGISPEADLEEIKAAYRRLSKEYHPDTTSLPLKTASTKFIQLREVYNVLSKEETRRFYDLTLAQEAESRRAERMTKKLEDPYEQDLRNFESIPDMVDRLGGKNMKLSDQALTALTIDIAIIIFSIGCLVYVVLFKEPY